MKLITGSLIATALTGWAASLAADAKAGGCDALVGAWEYQQPTPPGNFVIARQGAKYIGVFFLTRGGPSPPRAEPSTDAEKAAAYARSSAGSWEFTCEGSAGKLRTKTKMLYSLNFAEVGTEQLVDIEVQGDQVKWWHLGEDGKRGSLNAARRLR